MLPYIFTLKTAALAIVFPSVVSNKSKRAKSTIHSMFVKRIFAIKIETFDPSPHLPHETKPTVINMETGAPDKLKDLYTVRCDGTKARRH